MVRDDDGEWSNAVTETLQINTSAGNSPPSAIITTSANAEVGVPLDLDGANSTDLDGYISSYLWDFGDGTTATVSQPNHIYSMAGTYTITLQVTDNIGAISNTTTTVTITSSSSGSSQDSEETQGGFDLLGSDIPVFVLFIPLIIVAGIIILFVSRLKK